MINKYGLEKSSDGHIEYEGISYYHSEFNVSWLKRIGIRPNMIFDVGAHYGGDSLRFKLNFPECSVHAFEAEPEAYSVLKNIEKYGVISNCFAVSESDGEIDFYRWIVKGKIYMGSLLKSTEKAKRLYDHVTILDTPIKVKAKTVKSYCNDNDIQGIDLMHVDVEGAVVQVIKGLGDIRPRLINTEMNSIIGMSVGYDPIETDRTIKLLGYELIYEGSSDNLYEYVGCSDTR